MIGYALARLGGMVRPWMDFVPPPAGAVFERDVEVPMRDGVVLRVNVMRPAGAARVPVIMCAHPYGKDATTKAMYRVMRQPSRARASAWTTWEAPDPADWIAEGYAVVNCDLRGFHRSDGEGSLFTRAQGRDYHDLIEWAAAQPWSTDKVGLLGVSYLAISQWFAAAERPPHLAAICPWEGFTDLYADLCYPGGVREDGFVPFWTRQLRDQTRNRTNLREEQLKRPSHDAWWRDHAPDLEAIEVPALICASFSDHNLHTRGSFEGFRRIGSREKWLYTHRDGKWVAFYSAEAKDVQRRFFATFLKGEPRMDGVPRVRIEVRDVGNAVHAVRAADAWPPPSTPRALYLQADGTLRDEPATGVIEYDARRGGARFEWTVPDDLELVGAMSLFVEADTEVWLFAGVRKLRAGREIHFEGSFGFGRDLVTRGWRRGKGPLAVELLPSATLFRRGDVLRLDLQGRSFFRRHPLLGQFPSGYERSPAGKARLRLDDARLIVPIYDT